MATIPRFDRRTVLWLGLAYGVASTGLWAGLIASRSESDVAFVIADIRAMVNFGGGYLNSAAHEFLFGTQNDMSQMSSSAWAWYWGADFVGALLQGLGYAVLGLAFVRCWRQSRARAVAGAIAVALIVAASYKVGTVFYERANCVSTVEYFDDGVETFTQCDAPIFGSGEMWMTVAFAAVVVIVALPEMRTRSSRQPSTPA